MSACGETSEPLAAVEVAEGMSVWWNDQGPRSKPQAMTDSKRPMTKPDTVIGTAGTWTLSLGHWAFGAVHLPAAPAGFTVSSSLSITFSTLMPSASAR